MRFYIVAYKTIEKHIKLPRIAKYKGTEVYKENDMTFKEKLKQECPENVIEECKGACYMCPYSYGYEAKTKSQENCKRNGGKGCEYCWNREMEEGMRKEFTKGDLEVGMVIRVSNGIKKEWGLYIGGYFAFNMYGFLDLRDFDYKMQNNLKGNYQYIDAIGEPYAERCRKLPDLLNESNIKIIWQRKETERMTAEEMAAKLYELTGKEIEVKPSHNEMLGAVRRHCYGMLCAQCKIQQECEHSEKGFASMTAEEIEPIYNKLQKGIKRRK